MDQLAKEAKRDSRTINTHIEKAPLDRDFQSAQRDQLRLVASGKTDREIAEDLFISSATVSTHVRNLLNKTGVANRTEATAYAVLRGLAGDEDSVGG